MLWDLHKAHQRKRKRMLQYKSHKKTMLFIRYMHLARYFIDLWMGKTHFLDFHKDFEKLPWAIKDFVCNKYRHEKFNQPMLKEDMDIYEAWRLYELAKKISGEAYEARKEADRLLQHYRAVHALMRHKIRKCMAA